MEYSREEALKLMKITMEVRKVLTLMLMEIDKNSKKNWFHIVFYINLKNI